MATPGTSGKLEVLTNCWKLFDNDLTRVLVGIADWYLLTSKCPEQIIVGAVSDNERFGLGVF